jgi:hypothetical protein
MALLDPANRRLSRNVTASERRGAVTSAHCEEKLAPAAIYFVDD